MPRTGDFAEDPRPGPTRFELLLDFLKVRFWSIVGVGFLAGAAILYFEVSPELPRFWTILLLSAIALAPYGWIIGSKIVDLLYEPTYVWLVDLDARYLDGAIYRFPESEWHKLDVREGELTHLSPSLYAGKDVDLENLEVTGNWRGTLDDRELCRALQAVFECRGQLQDDARRGFAIETSAFTIIRNAVRETTLSVVRTFETGALPDEGDALAASIDDQLEQFNLDQRIDDFEDRADDLDLAPEPEDEPNPETDFEFQNIEPTQDA